jgi:hypothetical protein
MLEVSGCCDLHAEKKTRYGMRMKGIKAVIMGLRSNSQAYNPTIESFVRLKTLDVVPILGADVMADGIENSLVCLVWYEQDPVSAAEHFPPEVHAAAKALSHALEALYGVMWAVGGGYQSLTGARSRLWVLRLLSSWVSRSWSSVSAELFDGLRALLSSPETASALDSASLWELGEGQGALAACLRAERSDCTAFSRRAVTRKSRRISGMSRPS